MKLSINPPVIAHRGASAFAPENTLAAFSKAKAIGAKWVEFDVMLASCGEVVVIHDETLNRTTNGKGKVDAYPYSYLRTLDAGSWFNPLFSGERIPTLHEVIDLLFQLQLSANIEIKAQPGKEDLTVRNVLQVLEKHWQVTMSPPLISSFSIPILEIVREKSPTSLIGFLMDSWEGDWKRICNHLQCVAVDINHELLNLERVQEIKSIQRSLLAYTVNDSTRAKELFSWGVDAVFSDHPERVMKLGS